VKPETRNFYEQAVYRAVERVAASLDQALDLEALAHEAALSPFHFHRIFRGMIGETPLELHRRLRMERAAFTLLEATTPITTIAFDAGYDTHEAFTRAFRDRFACSPTEFRRSPNAEGVECRRPLQIELAARSGIHFDPAGLDNRIVHFIRGETVMNVDIKDMEEIRTIGVRHVGPYSQISEAFGRLGEIAGRAGILGTKPTMIAIYYDDPEVTPEGELRSDAAIAVPESAPVPKGTVEERFPAGRYACTVHEGPYERLGDTWARFMGQWLPQSGHRIAGPTGYEIYLNTPMDVPKEQLRTELYVQLAS
jgi:AraC family transcriptional regulator